MENRLRLLVPNRIRTSVPRRSMSGLYWCGVLAVVLQLTFSSNVISQLGYTANIHPATILVAMGAVLAAAYGLLPLHRRFHDTPALMLFVVGIPVVTLYAIYFAGFSGSTVYIESFWSAGILALLVEPATDRQKRLLGYILIALVLLNVVLALYESVTHTELFQLTFETEGDQKPTEVVDDFRAHAFFAHPLTASLVTSMAIFLLYQMRLRMILAAPIFGLLLVGLLAFGGRTALGVTVLVSAAVAVGILLTGLVKRKLSLQFLMTIVLAVVVIPPIVGVIVTETTIADRIIHNLYYDDSAAVRTIQWEIFNYLPLKNWLFGISKEQLAGLKYQIELGGKDTDIENFWILIFLDLGVFGFTVFLALFGGFLLHLARYTRTLNGWLLVGSALVIDSTSNSLGVWSNDLLIEVAFMVAISGFRDHVPARSLRRVRTALPVLRPLSSRYGGLMLGSGPLRVSNLRKL